MNPIILNPIEPAAAQPQGKPAKTNRSSDAMYIARLLNPELRSSKKKPPRRKPKGEVKTGLIPFPIYTLELRDGEGKLEIPFAVEPLASEADRINRGRSISLLIALLMQIPNDSNFQNLADAVGEESAKQVREFAGDGIDRFRCRLLNDEGRCIQTLHTHRPAYQITPGTPLAIETVAKMAKGSS